MDGMGELVGREAGSDDGVDGEEGEGKVGAFSPVLKAEVVCVAEEGMSVFAFSFGGCSEWGCGGWHGLVEG